MKSPKSLQLLREPDEPDSWRFVFPTCVRDFDEVYDKIQDNWDYTDSKPSSQIAELESLIERCPDYLDAYNLLAIILENTGNLDLSIQVWERGFDLIRMAIPPEFDFDKHQINYYVLSNRPYFRICYGLAEAYIQRATRLNNKYKFLKTWNFTKAVDIFENLIKVHLSDNVGARIKLVQCYLSLNRYKDVLKLAAKYPDGASADVEYAAALAAIKLGDTRKANKYIDKAIHSAPLIAEILLLSLPKQPKAFHETNLISGSAFEAYYYWLHNHLFWDKKVLSFLETKRDLIEQVKTNNRNNWGSAFPPNERDEYPAIFSLQASGVC
ncbi:MAG: tetratricopeptide repeat protein [Scytonematopsis contorta HA4267-MV1]|jgi:hypothetical protein|nr:tetratricopeptide repeat protein [Scytonematopsis contorta HA4267-MV1]